MGHFSYSCKLSSLPITGGTPATLIVMKHRDDLYEYSDEKLKQYGQTNLCSNDITQAKFEVYWFPIHGTYDDYGGLEDIQRDDNVELLEQHYGLSIDEIIAIVTSNRKHDGYDDALKVIKKPLSADYDPNDDYGNPQYEERYLDLLKLSGMWVHGEFYKQLTDKCDLDLYNGIDLGTPELLVHLGFTEIDNDPNEDRYNRRFEKDGLIVNSDDNWLSCSVYTLPDFKKYCNNHGVELNNIDELMTMGRTEQILELIIPNSSFEDRHNRIDKILEQLHDIEERVGDASAAKQTTEYKDLLILLSNTMSEPIDDQRRRMINFLLLNRNEYSIKNEMTPLYFEAAKQGKMKDSIVRFHRFNTYMYATGTYYDLIGTSPQDGEHKDVLKVLTIAKDVLEKDMAELGYDECDDDDE